ncbi:hypothetical protein EBT25_14265, partial [bacterium]|nr:hypothetical protein [bacterium]
MSINDLKLTHLLTTWESVLNNADTVKLSYALPGTYTVILKADYLGCVSQNTQKAFAFVKPEADFDLKSGRCENNRF